MSIYINKQDKTINIKDGLKQFFLILKIFMLLNVAVVIINLADTSFRISHFYGYLNLFIGLIALAFFFYLSFNKASDKIIHIDKINQFRVKTILRMNVCSLKLSNGKIRSLISIRSTSDISELRDHLSTFGVDVKVN